MKLSVNVENLMGRLPFEKCAAIYAQAGFDALDYALTDMVRDASPFNGDAYATRAERIRETAQANGLVINQTHAPFTFPFEMWVNEKTYRDTVYPRLVRSIEISAIMGAEVVVMHPLHHYFPYRGREQEAFEANMEFYGSLIPYCKEFGIKVGIENMWQDDCLRGTIVHDTCSRKEEFIRYVDTLDSEYMVACLDTGHIGLPQYQTDEAQDVIRALGHNRLGALHVHDNSYRRDDHALPFSGKLKWGEITRALGEIDYMGDLTYEVNLPFYHRADEDFIPVAAKYMADVGRYLISKIEAARPAAEGET